VVGQEFRKACISERVVEQVRDDLQRASDYIGADLRALAGEGGDASGAR